MPNSDWIKPTAIGLIAIALTLIWAAFYVGSEIGESRGQSNKHTAEYERHAEEQIRAACLSGQSGDIAKCVSKVVKATNEHKRAEGDLVAQTEMARWSFFMLLATIGVALISGAGVYYVWRTLRVTREIGEAQVSAYIGVLNSPHGFHIESINVDEFASGCVYFKNSGQSPARNVKIAVFCDTRSAMFPLERRVSMGDAADHRSSIPPNGQIEVEFTSELKMTREFVRLVDKGVSKPLSVFGTVWYEDVFKKSRMTEFNFFLASNKNEVYSLDWETNPLDNPVWEQAPYHNSET